MPSADQSSLRFLWREDHSADIVVYQYTRHIFGAKDSPTCANYALQRCATDNQAKYPDAALAIQQKFYMDDYLDSVESVEKALQRSRDFVELLNLGGFKLTKFVSNVPQVALDLNDSETGFSKELLAPAESECHVLGLKWNTETDTLA